VKADTPTDQKRPHPVTFDIPMSAPSLAGQASARRLEVELDWKGKALVWASIVSPLFLSQIAYNMDTFAVSPELICYALFSFNLVVSGYVSLSFLSLLLFASAVALAAFRIPFSNASASWTSLLLLLTLYAPFAFRLRNVHNPQPVQEYIERAFVAAATVIGVISLVQIIVVNVVKSPLLTNIHFVLPEAIRSVGAYTYSREGGGLTKANGFFLRESSTLSLVMGLAIVLEYYAAARWRVLGILAGGLVSSFSGSGIIAIIAGFLLPRSLGRIPIFIAEVVGVIIVLFVLYNADIPYLNVWLGRLDEFTTPSTSAYARFVAPLEMIQHSFDQDFFSTWFGNGAGSYLRETSLLKVRYEINDPTWAKVIFEYGLLGFALLLSVVMLRIYSSNLQVEACNFLLFMWIANGLLLKPDFILVIWLFSLVPKRLRPPAVRQRGLPYLRPKRLGST
jgi:hypothetical protein